MKISRPCVAGMHAACKETRESCACADCHLGPCIDCQRDNLGRIFDGRCADCERKRAHAAEYVTHCARCDAPGAFRNPSDRRGDYLCVGCHAEVGESIASPIPLASLIRPDCMGKDISDDAHVWTLIRGSQFACRCGTKKHDAKLRDKMKRVMW